MAEREREREMFLRKREFVMEISILAVYIPTAPREKEDFHVRKVAAAYFFLQRIF